MIQITRQREVREGTSYDLCFDWIIARPGGTQHRTDGGFSYPCDQHGTVDETELNEAALDNYRLCAAGTMRGRDGSTVSAGYVRPHRWRHVIPATARCDACGEEAEMHPSCGAWVCHSCDNHLGLARCFCGWSASGGDGQRELIEMGEVIDPD